MKISQFRQILVFTANLFLYRLAVLPHFHRQVSTEFRQFSYLAVNSVIWHRCATEKVTYRVSSFLTYLNRERGKKRTIDRKFCERGLAARFAGVGSVHLPHYLTSDYAPAWIQCHNPKSVSYITANIYYKSQNLPRCTQFQFRFTVISEAPITSRNWD